MRKIIIIGSLLLIFIPFFTGCINSKLPGTGVCVSEYSKHEREVYKNFIENYHKEKDLRLVKAFINIKADKCFSEKKIAKQSDLAIMNAMLSDIYKECDEKQIDYLLKDIKIIGADQFIALIFPLNNSVNKSSFNKYLNKYIKNKEQKKDMLRLAELSSFEELFKTIKNPAGIDYYWAKYLLHRKDAHLDKLVYCLGNEYPKHCKINKITYKALIWSMISNINQHDYVKNYLEANKNKYKPKTAETLGLLLKEK